MIPPPSRRRSPLVRHGATRYPLSQIEQGALVLAVLGSLRFATAIQLRRAVFDARSTTPRQSRYRATKTLRRLFDAGLIDRVQVFCPSTSSDQVSMQVVQTLSAKGARAVGMDPRLARSRAPRGRSVLAHDFWLVELGVLAFEGCPPSLTITHWWNDRVLSARKRKGQLALLTIPDALLVVRNPATGKDYPCLVELDLGTESVNPRGSVRADFARKIEGYLDYSPAQFAIDFGIPAPPIILIATDSERRLGSLMATTHRLGGRGRFWFSTLPRLRGRDTSTSHTEVPSARLQGTFWGPGWQTARNDKWRSLADRCGL